MIEIKLKVETEEKGGGDIELFYIPEQTQVLEAGKRYRVIIEPPVIKRAVPVKGGGK